MPAGKPRGKRGQHINRERDAAVRAAVFAGEAVPEVALRYGLQPRRVRGLAKGMSPRSRQSIKSRLFSIYRPGAKADELAERIGITLKQLRNALNNSKISAGSLVW